jgi:hypothetical protein
MVFGHDFSVHPGLILHLLLPQGFGASIVGSVFSAVLQELQKRARQDSNLRPAD